MNGNEDVGWKIGEFAEKTGMTVRALHHYDELGLLTPSRRTESGHRLYAFADLRKLLRIIALKQLGLSLDEIRGRLERPDEDPLELLASRLSRLDEQLRELEAERERVADLHRLLSAGRPVSNELFLAALRLSPLLNSPHFRPEQLRRVRDRYLEDGEESAAEELLERFRSAREAGRPPHDPEVAALAARWQAEMERHGLTDPSLVESAERYYRERPEDGSYFGMDGQLYAYIRSAMDAASIR